MQKLGIYTQIYKFVPNSIICYFEKISQKIYAYIKESKQTLLKSPGWWGVEFTNSD